MVDKIRPGGGGVGEKGGALYCSMSNRGRGGVGAGVGFSLVLETVVVDRLFIVSIKGSVERRKGRFSHLWVSSIVECA